MLLASAAVLLLSGCGEEEEIRSYTAPKSKPLHRMIAAIVPREEKTWFFKMAGDNDAVAELRPKFFGLMRSLTFQSGRPQWTLPPGWKEEPGADIRYATLLPPVSGDVEISVTQLPSGDNLTGYLAANVNRWRRQMVMSPIRSKRELDSVTVKQPLPAGGTWYYVEMEGRLRDKMPHEEGAAETGAGKK